MVQQQLRQRGISDQKVLAVMEQIPRHLFIPPPKRYDSYADRPVAIGHGQTISQPYIVALMTEKLQIKPEHRVLEVGTGCGYQTAILARLAHKVYTIELITELAHFGRDNLTNLEINNVEYHIGNGREGWPAELSTSPVPFDRIIVTAAADMVPKRLLEQLADTGRMVIPVGRQDSQKLMLLQKNSDLIEEKILCYCRFVELRNASR